MTREKLQELIGKMTLEEKASLCSGADFWHTESVERLGIPAMMVSDGPHGLRKQDQEADHLGVNDSIKAVCFPAGCGTAASFSRELITGMGEVLSRQGGTSGGMSNRGAGETKLELDKRKIRHRISELKKELKVVEKNRETQRKRRLIQGIPQVALVGYTNAGKSTLMNALLDKYEQKDEKKVLAEDMLFATLDTTIRSIHLPDKKEFLISDTVGFINKLPHNLVQAFHSTLEEVKYADLLLEIVDYSDENHKDQMKVTEDTLRELGAEQIPCIHVYNKCDGIIEPLPQIRGDDIYMAAKRGIGLEELVEMISGHIYQNYVDCVMLIPYTEGALVSYFSENATVKETEYLAEGTKLTMNCLLKDLKKYKQYVVI